MGKCSLLEFVFRLRNVNIHLKLERILGGEYIYFFFTKNYNLLQLWVWEEL